MGELEPNSADGCKVGYTLEAGPSQSFCLKCVSCASVKVCLCVFLPPSEAIQRLIWSHEDPSCWFALQTPKKMTCEQVDHDWTTTFITLARSHVCQIILIALLISVPVYSLHCPPVLCNNSYMDYNFKRKKKTLTFVWPTLFTSFGWSPRYITGHYILNMHYVLFPGTLCCSCDISIVSHEGFITNKDTEQRGSTSLMVNG